MVMNADGSGATPLFMRPATPSQVQEPTWGPDSRKVVAVAVQNAVANLYVRSEESEWWISRGVYAPDWSPDGSRIVVQGSRRPGLCIIEVTSTGEPAGAPRRLLALPACQPAWSPDGRWIVFSSPQGLGVIDAEGMTMALLTQESGQYPAWYP